MCDSFQCAESDSTKGGKRQQCNFIASCMEVFSRGLELVKVMSLNEIVH